MCAIDLGGQNCRSRVISDASRRALMKKQCPSRHFFFLSFLSPLFLSLCVCLVNF